MIQTKIFRRIELTSKIFHDSWLQKDIGIEPVIPFMKTREIDYVKEHYKHRSHEQTILVNKKWVQIWMNLSE